MVRVMTTTQFEQLLRANNLRVTATRLAVMNCVAQNPHTSAEAVLGEVRAQLGTASVQAIYDVLHTLANAKILNCVEPAGHPARYELRVGDNHHHVVCRSCGMVADVDCSVGHAPCLIPVTDHGFIIESAEVLYWGTCANCQQK